MANCSMLYIGNVYLFECVCLFIKCLKENRGNKLNEMRNASAVEDETLKVQHNVGVDIVRQTFASLRSLL